MKNHLSLHLLLLLSFCLCCITVQAKRLRIDELTGVKLYANNSLNNQSATNYGRWLFLVSNKLVRVSIYDLQERRLVFTRYLKPHEEETSGKGVLYHCNQSDFGTERYDKDDMFPLLYVSVRIRPEDDRGSCTALRIIPSFNAKNEIDSFDVQEVQHVYFPSMTDKNCMGTPNVAIDRKRGMMVSYNRNHNLKATNWDLAQVTLFKLPGLRNSKGDVQKEVFLEDKDIKDHFAMPWHMMWVQGGFCRDGLLVVGQGAPSRESWKNHTYLRVIDLKKHKQKLCCDLIHQYGLKHEPEGVFFYDGKILIATNNNEIYEVTYR